MDKSLKEIINEEYANVQIIYNNYSVHYTRNYDNLNDALKELEDAKIQKVQSIINKLDEII